MEETRGGIYMIGWELENMVVFACGHGLVQVWFKPA